MDWIRIRGARQHNLQGIDVEIPRGRFVVVTGPSGSGKSSLAFHTLYAEGQRRYVESLSAYARQFIGQLDKPDVESIEGLSPAIAIDQRPGALNPRSTVATATEIHDWLRVLWAAAGTPHDPKTGERLARMGAADIVASLAGRPERTRVVLLAPLEPVDWEDPARLIGDLRRQGFVRVRVDGEIVDLDDAEAVWPEQARRVEVVVDRLVVREGIESRLADSVETALRLRGAQAMALVQSVGSDEWEEISFQTSWRNPKTGFEIGALTPRHFSFNSHLGACRACEGLGTEVFCDPELLVADPEASLVGPAIRGWWTKKSRRLGRFRREAAALLGGAGLPEDAPFSALPEELREVLFYGGDVATGWKVGSKKREETLHVEGLCPEAERCLRETKSESVRRRLARVMSRRSCRSCGGRRLKPGILAVRIEGSGGRWLGIHGFCELPVEDAILWFEGICLPSDREDVCERMVDSVRTRLGFLERIGLGYLGLDRTSGTLSGGEAQRIRLASQLGGGLSGVLYVLDEPSVGLHAEDTGRLIRALENLRDSGNTVVVVEHDEAIIRASDWMIDMGPGAGREGGRIMAAGSVESLIGERSSPTGMWLGEGSRSAGVPPVPSAESFVSPLEPCKSHIRRLPHWEQDSKTYFVTWRLADSLPKEKLEAWRGERETWRKIHPEPWSDAEEAEYHERFSKTIDMWLDQGSGECILKDPQIAKIVADALRHFDGDRYLVDAFVVMPNHVHVLFRLKLGEELAHLLHSWKSFTAKKINDSLGRDGIVWQREYWDRLVRNSEHHIRVRNYIRRNPERAKLGEGQFVIFEAEDTGGTPALLEPAGRRRSSGEGSDTGGTPALLEPAGRRRSSDEGSDTGGTPALLEPALPGLGTLRILGAREHNLLGIDVEIPLGRIVCVAGPSGSGKSTLVDDVLGRVLARRLRGATEQPGAHDAIEGLELLGKFVKVDQVPIGRSPRSNPATFSGAFDLIRRLFAGVPLSRQRGYNAGRFSFNTRGGRCEKCEGAGRLKIEMSFLPDAWVTCDACGGRRFNRETLEVTYKGRNITEVLEMTVDEACEFFRAVPKLVRVFEPLRALGLGYLRLGQSATTLSGGEAQRLKLALELARPAAPHTLYLFDEPTTGLNFGDVGRLLDAFRGLRSAGHSVLVVEHNLDVIAAADHVIDLGPGGGKHGGKVIAAGNPREIAANPESPTGRALRKKIEGE